MQKKTILFIHFIITCLYNNPSEFYLTSQFSELYNNCFYLYRRKFLMTLNINFCIMRTKSISKHDEIKFKEDEQQIKYNWMGLFVHFCLLFDWLYSLFYLPSVISNRHATRMLRPVNVLTKTKQKRRWQKIIILFSSLKLNEWKEAIH